MRYCGTVTQDNQRPMHDITIEADLAHSEIRLEQGASWLAKLNVSEARRMILLIQDGIDAIEAQELANDEAAHHGRYGL